MASVHKKTISLPQEHTDFIDSQVESGAYGSASEVVRAGLRALQERDSAVERWLREEVADTRCWRIRAGPCQPTKSGNDSGTVMLNMARQVDDGELRCLQS